MKQTKQQGDGRSITLKALAEHLQLSPSTVSLVVNRAPGYESIAPKTRERVLAAAKELNYKANFLARSLRTSQSFTIGVIVPEVSEGYFPMVMSGVEHHLREAGYLYFVVSHEGKDELLADYPQLLTERAVDGCILINTLLKKPLAVPIVSISGLSEMPGVVNLMLNHDKAASLALRHLHNLGHREIAFMKGPPHIPDSQSRWDSIRRQSRAIGIRMRPELCLQIRNNSWTPELGYPLVRDLLAKKPSLTAIFCFNDVSAIGAIRAIVDAGLRCPDDISVIGFDDIASAAFSTPSLTTIRQPLISMGETAVQVLLKRIQKSHDVAPNLLMFEPQLIVRESTAQSHKLKKLLPERINTSVPTEAHAKWSRERERALRRRDAS
jgi:DNA-binding LacI/PurR family transcriptional regulator